MMYEGYYRLEFRSFSEDEDGSFHATAKLDGYGGNVDSQLWTCRCDFRAKLGDTMPPIGFPSESDRVFVSTTTSLVAANEYGPPRMRRASFGDWEFNGRTENGDMFILPGDMPTSRLFEEDRSVGATRTVTEAAETSSNHSLLVGVNHTANDNVARLLLEEDVMKRAQQHILDLPGIENFGTVFFNDASGATFDTQQKTDSAGVASGSEAKKAQTVYSKRHGDSAKGQSPIQSKGAENKPLAGDQNEAESSEKKSIGDSDTVRTLIEEGVEDQKALQDDAEGSVLECHKNEKKPDSDEIEKNNEEPDRDDDKKVPEIDNGGKAPEAQKDEHPPKRQACEGKGKERSYS